jgi:asparagine synthase (glutamine-hydrolysing)
MNAAMASRGPDEVRMFTDYFAGLSLASRRLGVIDPSRGRQPVSNEDTTVWAVLDGEVYNHPQLRDGLRRRGHRFVSGVDTEVLVHLYEEHGAAMVERLEGMYAFALWDGRREELLVGRDRFGEKPLFYTEQHGELHFASELDALLAGIDGVPEIDAASVDAFFVFGYVPWPASMVSGVKQLPPGHLLRWDGSSKLVRVNRYWEPADAAPQSPCAAFDDLVAETGRVLDRAVRSRLIADAPLGVLLSGGLDSVLVAALAARASGGPIKTFTVGFDTWPASEIVNARLTAQELGTEHHELVLTEDELLGRVPPLLSGMDQPLADPGLVLLHATAEHASREVTVAVGDEGADEVFGGYSRYRWLWRSEWLSRALPSPLAAGLSQLAARGRHRRAGRLADILRPGEVLERHLDWVTGRRSALRSRLYGPALQAIQTRFTGDLEGRLNGTSAGQVIRRLMVLDQVHRLPDAGLVKADRSGMRVSLEVRTPYLNRELAEFAATVPDRVHVQDGGKALLRRLLAEVAPSAAARCSKTRYEVPTADWLRGPLAPLLDHQVADGSAFAEGWFDRREAAALVAEHRAGAQDASSAIWPLLTFGLWLDRIRGRGSGDPDPAHPPTALAAQGSPARRL